MKHIPFRILDEPRYNKINSALLHSRMMPRCLRLTQRYVVRKVKKKKKKRKRGEEQEERSGRSRKEEKNEKQVETNPRMKLGRKRSTRERIIQYIYYVCTMIRKSIGTCPYIQAKPFFIKF